MRGVYLEDFRVSDWNDYGFITGVDRCVPEGMNKVTHLYQAKPKPEGGYWIMEPEDPLCKRGWNRDGGEGYSIWRNNMSRKGVCKVCAKKALPLVKERQALRGPKERE